jgi:hypothetical protein
VRGKLRTAAALGIMALVVPSAASGQQLKCDVGSIAKMYGKTQWLVYSCSDGRSIVVLAAQGSPATPFYFILHP